MPRRGSSALLTTLSGHIRRWEIVKVIRNPLDLKSEVRIKVQEKKNEQKCWFLEKSSLNWVFFYAYQLYTVHITLRSWQKLVRVRSDINLHLSTVRWKLLSLTHSLTVKLQQFFDYTLFHTFNNRWRWCCGHFNFRQKILEQVSQKSLNRQNFCHIPGLKYFHHIRSIKARHLLCIHGIIELVSRQLCRRYIVKWKCKIP